MIVKQVINNPQSLTITEIDSIPFELDMATIKEEEKKTISKSIHFSIRIMID